MNERQILDASPHINPLSPPNTDAVRPAQQLQNTPGVKPAAESDNAESSNTEPRAFGSFSVPYTAARVEHLPTGNIASNNGGYLSATYPYRAIGRLTFQDDSGSFTCSASLIRRSVIVTAAHCIQDFGSGNDTFRRWTFTPAFHDGSAPYGSWSWRVMVRPSSWTNGTDTGSGAARNNDLAVMALGRNSSNQFIGDLTGWLNYGWNNYSFVSHPRTGNLAVAALSALGYPGLLDQGRIMQRSDGPSYLTTVSGASQIYQGSTFTGGASGGPWIANFKYKDPVFSNGAGPGDSAANNVIVGVTSWGAANPNTPKDNYSSQFGQNSEYPNASYGTYGAGNIGSLLNTLCSFVTGGSTLADQGYCD
ncbi:trypsin-like serine peptidase, partial [Leptolyngbya sp. Heron Island J]|uniref:trypsin-like serine peptidase n=1 Tax=Leptolyngbya sp. Heron Island J TaxID=1385935 RepID=UPI00055C048C